MFFPIDGFIDINKETVDQAKEDLVNQLHEIFGVETQSGIVDQTHPSFEWN